MRVSLKLFVLLIVATFSAVAFANTVVLDFEGIATTAPNSKPIGNFYADIGVTFSPNALALCLNTPGVGCSNTSRGGLGDPNSQGGGLFFLTEDKTFMTFAEGFSNGFSLLYSAIYFGGSLTVYDGLNGTGNVLATLPLQTTPSACDKTIYQAGFCPFLPVGVSFSGTARSIGFSGVANQIVFDDVTFGSATPGPPAVPEPASMVLFGTGLLAVVRRLRKRA